MAEFIFLIFLIFVTVGMWWLGLNYNKYCERPDSQGFSAETDLRNN